MPAPVGPTMATVLPGATSRSRCSMSGVSSLYRKETSANRTPPLASLEQRGRDRVGDLLRLVQQLEHALRGGDGRLDEVGDAGRLDDGHRELAGVLDERHDIAQGHGPGRDLQAADDRDGHVVEVGHEVERGLDDARDELGLSARLVQALVLGPERLDGLLLPPEQLDDAVAGVHLLDMSVEGARGRPLDHELGLRPLGDDGRDDQRQGHGEDGDEGQQRADGEHHERARPRWSAAR